MELTPQSAHSPGSPYRYISSSNPQPLYEYPSPAHSDSRYRSTDSVQGLGLYSGPMSGPTEGSGGTVPHLQSSTATNNWPAPTLQHRSTPRSSHPSTPNIFSADYDPFAPFHPSVSAAYSHDIYSTSTAEVAILPASPLPSGKTSQRSSFSSAPGSDILTQAGSINSYTPRIKMEDNMEYAPSNDSMMLNSPQPRDSLLATSGSSYPGSLEATYYKEQSPMNWPKIEYTSTPDLPSFSNLPNPGFERRTGSQDRVLDESYEQRREQRTASRTRQPRKLTTKEDANFQCHVKGCGKLFGRSYNFKAHMETHDASREYPFPCPLEDCNKKFVRKTDLQRHHQSVHMKQRNHRCDYCSRFFARKDTLRRHMEDGCSKRFDIETVDFRPQSYGHSHQNSMKVVARPIESQSRHPSYSSSTQFSPQPGNSTSLGTHATPLTSASEQFMSERQEYRTEGNTHDSTWAS